MKKFRKSYRANNTVQVLGKVTDTQYQDIVHAGTPRDGRRGGCYKGNGVGYVNVVTESFQQHNNLEFDFYINGVTQSTSIDSYVAYGQGINRDRFFIYGFQGELRIGQGLNNGTLNVTQLANGLSDDTLYHINIKIFGTNLIATVNDNEVYNESTYTVESKTDTTLFARIGARRNTSFADKLLVDRKIWGVKINELNSSGNLVQNLAFYKCDENSGSVCYDSSGNGYHGQIMDAVTITPEVNPLSIHQYQDEFSLHNVVGYSGGNGSVNTSNLLVGEAWLNLNPGELVVDRNQPYIIKGTVGDFTIPPGALLASNIIESTGGDNSVIQILYGYNTVGYPAISFQVADASTKYITFALCATNRFLTPNDSFLVSFNGGDITDYSNYTVVFNGSIVQTKITPSPFGIYLDHTELWRVNASNYGFNGEFSLDVNGNQFIQYNSFIPRIESIQLPPFKDVLGNDLQYIGHCQNDADFVGSACFKGNDDAHLSIQPVSLAESDDWEISFFSDAQMNVDPSRGMHLGKSGSTGNYIYNQSPTNWLIADSTNSKYIYFNDAIIENLNKELRKYTFIKVGSDLSLIVTYKDKELVRVSGVVDSGFDFNLTFDTIGGWYNYSSFKLVSKIASVAFKKNGTLIHHWSLCESIKDALNHTYFDKVGENHATLINGSLDNQGSQDEFHDLMVNGFTISDGVNYYKDQALTQLIPLGHYIPAHASISGKCVAYTTGGVLADLTVVRDGESFLDCGTKLRQKRIPEMIDDFWFNPDGTPKDISYSDIVNVYNDRVFADVSEKSNGIIRNIRTHKAPLVRAQLDTEKRITNNLI